MALSFLNGQPRKPDRILSIDLGSKTTKAALVQRRGEKFNLLGFAVQDTPPSESALTADQLGAHIKAVATAVGGSPRFAAFTLGINDVLLRQADLPLVAPDDMRLMLKFNSKTHLQQEYPGYTFDCQLLNLNALGPDGAKPGAKVKTLVGGAKKDLVDQLATAAKAAGLTAIHVAPPQAGIVNAFELAQPEAFAKEVVALVDIGFRNSSICLLNQGELALNRLVGIGADKLTNTLAETLSISYAEAESIKLGLPEEVQAAMQALLIPLGRELRASIDFFEHQSDKTVSQVFISGGSARSQFIVDSIQSELMVQCKAWNPTSAMNLELPAQQLGEVEQAAPQLAIAIGSAIGAL
ncbi:MAG TPA: pilus assembly protein PilM [Methylomirabilota bacterium]|nr:pilus assembly protein PilM [Methylomirabilota bacterium]